MKKKCDKCKKQKDEVYTSNRCKCKDDINNTNSGSYSSSFSTDYGSSSYDYGSSSYDTFSGGYGDFGGGGASSDF